MKEPFIMSDWKAHPKIIGRYAVEMSTLKAGGLVYDTPIGTLIELPDGNKVNLAVMTKKVVNNEVVNWSCIYAGTRYIIYND